MSNFLASTASTTQKNLILLELFQFIGDSGYGRPISSRGSQNIVDYLQFKNNAPSSASAANAMTNRNIAHKVKNAPFNLIGCVGLDFHPMKKCPHALLCAFASNEYDALEWMFKIIYDA
jgi:hypothetical protein